jgi:hypothetical protein
MENSEALTLALDQLSSQLCANAKKLSSYLQSEGQVRSSLEIDTPVNVLEPNAAGDAHHLRNKLKQDALKLFRLVSGPSEYVAHIALNVILTPSMTLMRQMLNRILASIYNMPPLSVPLQNLRCGPRKRLN